MVKNNSEITTNTNDRKEHKLLRKSLAVALAGAVALGAAGCSGDKVGATTPEVKPPATTEALANPTETEAPRNSTEQYADDMEVYKEMSIDEFEALPMKDRLQYSQFLIDETESRDKYELFYTGDGPGKEYFIKPSEMSIDSSAQEILDYHRYICQLAYLQIKPSTDPSQAGRIDVINAQKLLTHAYYFDNSDNFRSNEHLDNQQTISSLDKITSIKMEPREAIDNSGVMTGLGLGGEEIKYMDITYLSEDDGKNIVARYAYVNFTSYDGDSVATWQLDRAVYEDDINPQSFIISELN